MQQLVLNAKNIHKHVLTQNGVLDILKGLNLQVSRGQSVAIMGESGSGKSTLLGLLAGLDLPQQGEIYFNDREITVMDEDQRADFRANNTGFVFQSFYLMQELTALENVTLPLELFGHKKPQKIAIDWLNKLGLADRMKHLPAQLSGGEQQRVALCRAFAVSPSILFVDEPTANLDQKTSQGVIEQLFMLHKDSGNSVILATHDRKLANACDKVYQLIEGQLYDC